ncbi:MAG: triose-phosphate isomerase [Desulfarculus sp.]|nr:triose-phosphate isomerase [Pseudomonadota bacterium]MBU4600314.1 triose-phosphate isomerase [Pseudomonadota bacterium]MBV1714773.1 triose-phosphate isomerase [Desulfarculus sp.]MBV1740261.1 triose-phosphate isomerase [Desulfarculus sp.]
MSRKLMIAGNWKLHLTVEEAVSLAGGIASGLMRDDIDVLVIPGFLALEPVALSLSSSPVLVGGQNLFWEDKGAYTAEVSGPQLKAAGARYVLVGHSERRQYFGETEKTCRLRLEAALKAGLRPILCVGETQAERESGQTEGVLESQLAGGLAGLEAGQMNKVTIAYEPVWAIGTGLTATEEQAAQAHAYLRGWIGSRFDKDVANSTRILYGGSVNPANAAGLLNQPEVDGALVGGASLKAESFLGIIQAA